jgi:transposase
VAARQSYSKEFKDAIVSKIVNRSDGKTIAEVCDEEGVGKATAANWLGDRAKVPGMSKPKSSRKLSAEDKLKIVSETHALSDEDLGKYLRKEGLYSHQPKEWRAEILSVLNSAKKAPVRDERDQRITELEKELARKDKALAEASTLLILQKKVDLIWGKKGEEKK